MATVEFGHFVSLRDRLIELGVDPYEAMEPFKESFERFHRNTAPSDWEESLVKAYVTAHDRSLTLEQRGAAIDDTRGLAETYANAVVRRSGGNPPAIQPRAMARPILPAPTRTTGPISLSDCSAIVASSPEASG